MWNGIVWFTLGKYGCNNPLNFPSLILYFVSDIVWLFTHLKLCLAKATHNFKWVKLTHDTCYVKYIKFCSDLDTFIILCRGLFLPIDFKPWHNDSYVLGRCAMTFQSIPSCSSGFIQDFLDHPVLIKVWPMMYMSGAYNELFPPPPPRVFIQATSNLCTMILMF